MANTTLQGDGFYTFFAIQAIQNPELLWVGLGRPTAWSGAMPPPSNTTGLIDPIVYQQLSIAKLCRAVNSTDPYDYTWDNNGTTYYFKTITESEAAVGHDRWIYFETTFNPAVGGLAEFDFRALAVFHNLVPDAGLEDETVLLPAQVTSEGNRLLIDHDEDPTTIGGNKSFLFKYGIQVGG